MDLNAVATAPVVPEMGFTEQVAFLNSILESSTEYSIVAKDLDATILAWNEGARRIYGYEPSDVVGKASAFILHDPEDVASGRARAILDEVRTTGKWSGELRRRPQEREQVRRVRDHHAAPGREREPDRVLDDLPRPHGAAAVAPRAARVAGVQPRAHRVERRRAHDDRPARRHQRREPPDVHHDRLRPGRAHRLPLQALLHRAQARRGRHPQGARRGSRHQLRARHAGARRRGDRRLVQRHDVSLGRRAAQGRVRRGARHHGPEAARGGPPPGPELHARTDRGVGRRAPHGRSRPQGDRRQRADGRHDRLLARGAHREPVPRLLHGRRPRERRRQEDARRGVRHELRPRASLEGGQGDARLLQRLGLQGPGRARPRHLRGRARHHRAEAPRGGAATGAELHARAHRVVRRRHDHRRSRPHDHRRERADGEAHRGREGAAHRQPVQRLLHRAGAGRAGRPEDAQRGLRHQLRAHAAHAERPGGPGLLQRLDLPRHRGQRPRHLRRRAGRDGPATPRAAAPRAAELQPEPHRGVGRRARHRRPPGPHHGRERAAHPPDRARAAEAHRQPLRRLLHRPRPRAERRPEDLRRRRRQELRARRPLEERGRGARVLQRRRLQGHGRQDRRHLRGGPRHHRSEAARAGAPRAADVQPRPHRVEHRRAHDDRPARDHHRREPADVRDHGTGPRGADRDRVQGLLHRSDPRRGRDPQGARAGARHQLRADRAREGRQGDRRLLQRHDVHGGGRPAPRRVRGRARDRGAEAARGPAPPGPELQPRPHRVVGRRHAHRRARPHDHGRERADGEAHRLQPRAAHRELLPGVLHGARARRGRRAEDALRGLRHELRAPPPVAAPARDPRLLQRVGVQGHRRQRPRHLRGRARRDRAAAARGAAPRVAELQPRAHRVVGRRAGHRRSRPDDHRRERADGAAHGLPARRPRREPVQGLLHRARSRLGGRAPDARAGFGHELRARPQVAYGQAHDRLVQRGHVQGHGRPHRGHPRRRARHHGAEAARGAAPRAAELQPLADRVLRRRAPHRRPERRDRRRERADGEAHRLQPQAAHRLPLRRLLHGARARAHGARKTFDEGVVTNYELTVRSKAGRKIPVSFNAAVFRDTSGSVVGILAAAREIFEQKRIEQALREQQTYTRGLIESNIDALMTTDTIGIITDVNRQMCTVTGRAPEELIGTPFKEYFTDPKRAEDGIRKVLAEDRVTNYELTIRAKDGRETVVSYNATTFKGADGRLRGVFAAAREIAEQKRLEEQIRRQNRELTDTTAFMNNVLESSTEYSIIAKDLDGKVLAWNEGARRNYGYTSEEMVGKQNSRILHVPEDIESGRVKALLDTALETGKAEGVFERVRKSGQRFTASVAVTLRRDSGGAPVGYVLISKDITEQKRLEEQLRRKNEELEEQNRRVQEANRLKSEFLANMSHELRTPLNGIIGFAELIHEGSVGPVPDEQQEYLGDILTSARHLLQLINDVLDLAKVESGKMEFRPEPVDLAKTAGEVGDILRTLTAKKRIRLETEVDPALSGVVLDVAKLKQVLYNYLSNAVKFTPEDGRVAVRIRPEGADRFRLEVEDSGIGIQPQDLGRLFVEFQQLDASTAKKYQGTGLGLALTRRIVEGQGGEVGVESTPGKGSTFFAVLPRVPGIGTPASASDRGSGSPIGEGAGPRRVLVIEDDAGDRDWLVNTLGGAAYTVEVARARRFDAITLDLLLPDMNGWDVLRAIRAGERNRATPVVVVTVVAEKGGAAGMLVEDILVKPVAAADLLRAIERARVRPGASRTVLVVDDDAAVQKLVDPPLVAAGYRTLWTRDAAAGLAAAEAERPAVIVLDLLMPGIDGLEFLRRFRRTEIGRHTPVIVWTVKDLTSDERTRLRASAQAIVLKGEGSTATLLEELAHCVALAGASRSVAT